MRTIFSIALWGLAVLPADATGSIACTVADKSLELTVEGAVSSGTGAALVNAGGILSVRLAGTPAPASSLTLTRENVTQFWLDGSVLKLRLWRDIGSDVEADIVIEARRSPRDETEYPGTYRLELTLPPLPGAGEARFLKAKGKIACSGG